METATGWRPPASSSLNKLDSVLSAHWSFERAGESSVARTAPTVVQPLEAEDEIDCLMRDFNERFAVVAEGGSTSVVRIAYNADLKRRSVVSMTLDAFRLLYGNRYVSVPRQTRAGI